MASHAVLIYNPTAAPVTVNSQTVSPRRATPLAVSDTTLDLHSFTDAGCLVTSAITPGKAPCAVCGYQTGLGEILKPPSF